MERIIEEKSNSIAFLLQQKGSLHVKEPMGGSPHAPSSTVLGRLADSKKKIETQNLIKDVLEARANVVEKKIHELNLKQENLQKKKRNW